MSIRRTSPGAKRATGAPEKTDAEVKTILTEAMADSGATPAAVYAFHKTGVLLTADSAWNDAIEEYEALAKRPNIVV